LLFLILCIHIVAVYIAYSPEPRRRSFQPYSFPAFQPSSLLASRLLAFSLCSKRYALCAWRLFPFAFYLLPFTFLLFPSAALAANVSLAWDRNPESDIAGYRLYYGTASRNYTANLDVGNTDQHTVTGLVAGTTYYFAATAYDISGAESAYSAEVIYTTDIITHTITASAGNNGRITPAGSLKVNEGTNKTFSIHPDQNYLILNVKVDGVSVGTASSYTFSNITDDHTIEAAFVYIDPPPPADSDGDGVPDDQDHFPLDPKETTDTDGDGLGNNADPDDDNDGIPDSWEIMYGLNPLEDDASQDPDGDGITNLNEYLGGTSPDTFDENVKPDPPILISPSDEDVMPLTPVLQTEAFSDPDGADFHAASQWQIFRADDQVCVFEKTSHLSLTALTVPKLVLDEDTAYAWRVRFIDNHGLASEWSERAGFTTELNTADSDSDGIPDDQEVDPALDLDENGTPDSNQSNIKCVSVEGGSAQIGISIPNAEPIQSIVSLELQSSEEIQSRQVWVEPPSNLLYGLISFKLIVDEPGDEVVVTLHLSEAAPPQAQWFKYDPVEDVWQDYSDYTEFSADRKRVFLRLLDGGFGDADGIANGIIVDPLALSATSLSAAEITGGGTGSGAGCFIGVVALDTSREKSPAGWHWIGMLIWPLTVLLPAVLWVRHRIKEQFTTLQLLFFISD
jgi:chitinase